MSDQEHATVREWTDVLARIRFGTVKVAGKNITGARIKLVAGRLANYADSDGTRVRPGIARLAVDLETDYRTAKTAVSYLRQLGLLKLVKAGGRPGAADEYRLAIPEGILDAVEVWSPARHALEMERVREANRGKYKPRHTQPDPETCGGQESPQESELQGPVAPADDTTIPEPAGATGTAETGPAGATGADLRGPVAPATYQGPRHNYDRPDAEEVRTALTGPRATWPEEPDFAVVTAPLPERCEHGLAGGRRGDGRPACPLCRVTEDQAAGRSRPTPPPHRGIAPVIPLRSAR